MINAENEGVLGEFLVCGRRGNIVQFRWKEGVRKPDPPPLCRSVSRSPILGHRGLHGKKVTDMHMCIFFGKMKKVIDF